MLTEFFSIVKSDAFDGQFEVSQSFDASFRHGFGGAFGNFGDDRVARFAFDQSHNRP